MEFDHGKIMPISIEEEMKKSYITYAMTVIIGRALPDVRDGLKPAHRRILYAMGELGFSPDKPYKKSARIVGEVLGKFHPHGDTVVYDTMVRMAQDFSSRYLLIDGHGNLGSIDGDSPAAMRYTEARLAPLAMEMLRDIDKKTVDFTPNFDETLEEPVVLPARFPNLLVNGSAGIAVGMATNIPPHNLGEVIDGTVALMDNPDITVDELMQHIKGPDFPTGAFIMGRDGIRSAYTTGRGSITIRAKTRIEKMSNGKHRIVVSELPYQVNKARLIERIAELAVKEKRIDGITALNDESDREEPVRIVIELRRDANPNVVLNQLFKHSQLQTTFGVIMLALVDGEPLVLSLKELLQHYIEHQKEVVTRRTRFDLEKAEARAHILEGYQIALDNIDAVIALIRRSQTDEEARIGLMRNFGLTEKQAQAILDMRLRRLTGLEREKIDAELAELEKLIAELKAILHDEGLLLQVIRKELLEIKEKYADPRRTEIVAAAGEIDIEDLIADEDVVITITHQGYIKRLPVNTYRSQRRGGRGITGMGTKDEDFVEHLFITNTHNYILFLTNHGLVYRIKVYEIPEASRQARGTPIVNIMPLQPDETISAVIPIKDFSTGEYLFLATENGTVKKTAIAEYDSVKAHGLIAITLQEGDQLIGARLVTDSDEAILSTRNGKAIRFSTTDARPMGRTAQGVKGIDLDADDLVIGLDIARENADLLVVTENGYGKRTPVSEYRTQRRAGKGVQTIKPSKRNGKVVGIRMVRDDDDVMLITAEGIVIRMAVSDISQMGRATKGVTLIRLEDNDSVVALARVAQKEE
ncbi:MAG: DNA gyrase subunit A [Firmicutes bacterium]|nr:DNA gyrase subunit A [Bacillota bacterium]